MNKWEVDEHGQRSEKVISQVKGYDEIKENRWLSLWK